ncbi:MAG: MoaD/ThiS family protein [Planctomycetota bacterium]
MASVTVELPSLLSTIVDGERSVAVDAGTLAGVLSALTKRFPALDVHLFDETGGLREHVLCFHNGANSRWLESLDVPVAEGDTVTILQAVSGG